MELKQVLKRNQGNLVGTITIKNIINLYQKKIF